MFALDDETEQKEEPLNQVEITYIDPTSGAVCNREVFCDPNDWDQRYQARLLVSSELVNSLTEATWLWHTRFKQMHKRLEQSRMGYFVELCDIRSSLQKIQHRSDEFDKRQASKFSAPQPSEQEAAAQVQTPQGPAEVCPVHFFNPDKYLDRYTYEMLAKAIATFRAQLLEDIAAIQEKLQVVGGGTWRQLLFHFLKEGKDPMEMVIGLLKTVEDPLERREMTNTMTNGMQDLYDALLLDLEALKVEQADMERRQQEVRDREVAQLKEIADIGKEMAENKKELTKPGFEEPPEEDDTQEVAAAQAEMFEKREASLKEYMQNVRRVRAQLQEWKDRLAAECDYGLFTRLEDDLEDWKRRIREVERRTEDIDASGDPIRERNREIELKIKEHNKVCASIREKLAEKGPDGVDPDAMRYLQMQRDLKALQKQEKKTIAAMKAPNMRIKAMRAQLRVLYAKLGWEWDMSDSEDDDDGADKPYWQRRKIAVNGFLPFDQQDFLFSEQSYKKRRSRALVKSVKADEKNKFIENMKAKRQVVDEPSQSKILSRELAAVAPRDLPVGSDSGPNLFDTSEPSRKGEPVDPVHKAINAAKERLSGLPGSRQAKLDTPCWRRAPSQQERERKQGDLDRLQQLRQSFEIQLQQCVECFVELLPDSGALGDLRSRLSRTVASLGMLPEDPSAWQVKDIEKELQATCETLQKMIQEAISVGDQVHPISAAMTHSVRFSDLRMLLLSVLQSEHEMREALKSHPSARRRQRIENDDSPSIDSGRQLYSTSSSPRQRGQTAPGGSVDGGSEGGLSTMALARGASSADDLSDSLRLPPRLIAQSTSLLGGRQPKRELQRKVDFGFRPDGSGEDSLENWSLFKVSKASTATSGFGDSVSTGLGLTASSGFISDKMRQTETKVRRQREAVVCDFHEYMSQTRQTSQGSWRSGSAPSLSGEERKKKNLPHLPKLVNARSAGRSLSAANTATDFHNAGDLLSSWDKAPPKVTLRSMNVGCNKFAGTVSNKFSSTAMGKFAATAPTSGFAKW